MIKNTAFSVAYVTLRNQVKSTLLLGQQRIEQEKVRTYWETGKLIHSHLLLHKERADYGKQVVEKLSKDLAISHSVLWRCVQFTRAFPILAARRELSWAHYRALIAVADERKRLQLADQAEQRKWTSRDLEKEIKKIKGGLSNLRGGRMASSEVGTVDRTDFLNPPEFLKPIRGSLYTYRLRLDPIIQSAEPALRVDLGFSNYKEMSAKGFKAGDIVESVLRQPTNDQRLTRIEHPLGAAKLLPLGGAGSSSDSYVLKKSLKTAADLFTFKAYIERVIDGDTLLVQVDLGFGWWTRQYLRLRGIDCPEIDTTEGKKARRFVEKALENVPYVIISSTKSDKYDRYLADIFYTTKDGEQFLNNELLEKRFAVRM